MKVNQQNFKVLAIYILTLAFYACESPGYEAYEDWDLDDDTYIDNDEFRDGILGSDYYYGLFEDANLDFAQLHDAYYDVWDLDNDNAIDQEEWDNAVDVYYENYDEVLYGSFDDWDMNNNGEIDLGEYRAGVGDTGLFTDWDLDKDELINDDEFAQGVYQYWDTNGDGYIEAAEYEEWEPLHSD